MSRYKALGKKVYSSLTRLIDPPQQKPAYKVYRDIMTKQHPEHAEKPDE